MNRAWTTAALTFAVTLAAAAPSHAAPDPAPAQTGGACVAIVLPTVEGVDNSVAVAMSVRDLFVGYLTGPTLKSIPLQARLGSQAVLEAKQRGCTAVLTVSILRKAAGSRAGHGLASAVARTAGTAAAYAPGAAGAAAEVAYSAADTVATAASETRAKDEIRIDYHVSTPDGAVILAPKTETMKAKSNGEDLLTPLVTHASEAIAAVVVK